MISDILREIPLFSELNQNEITSIQQLISCQETQKGTIVLQEGDQGHSLFIIVSGSVKISKYAADGREVVLSLLNTGCFFGEMSLLDQQPRSASVTTLEDSMLAQINRDDFGKLLIQQPKVTLKLLSEIASRLRQTSKVLERISTLDVPHRLYYYLKDYADRFGLETSCGMTIIKLPTHQMIADQLSTSRETISRALSVLKHDSIICKADKPNTISIDMLSLKTLLHALA